MTIHIQTWPYAANARITDMTNAGKRGKKCRQLHFQGTHAHCQTLADPLLNKAAATTAFIMANFGQSRLHPEGSYWVVRDALRTYVEQARADGVPEDYLRYWEDEIRSVDAPRTPLTAGIPAVWSARADEEGIKLHDLADSNQWTELTPSSQTGPRAYDIARSVWPQVQAAATLSEAAAILRKAGAKLHGFCARD